MSDYWTDRAIPVLEALANPDDPLVRDGYLMLGFGRAEKRLQLGLSDDAIHDTILQLADAGYVEFKDVQYEAPAGAHFSGLFVTGRGMQVLGEWPRFEVLVSPLTLAALLEALAEYAAPEEAEDLRRAAAYVKRITGHALKSLAIGAGSQLLRGALGLS
jgi:hypothetical protein